MYFAMNGIANDQLNSNQLNDRPKNLPELKLLWQEDLDTYNGDWRACGFRALAVHRFGAYLHSQKHGAKRSILTRIYAPLYRRVRNGYGIDLTARTQVGRRVLIAHQSGIVIHPNAVIGDGCVIRQNVTLGAESDTQSDTAPKLGKNVDIGAGAVIAGAIEIGDNVQIGPNSVVMQNVKANTVAFGNPLRVLPRAAKT